MDEFQATPPEELTRLRAVSAQQYGDLLLTQAVRKLAEHAGAEALDELRQAVAKRIREQPDHILEGDDRPARLAVEELDRVIQIAREGDTRLRGWTEDAPPSIEEQKPGH